MTSMWGWLANLEPGTWQDWLVSFGMMAGLDWIWGRYTISITRGKAFSASWMAMAIVGFNAGTILAYVHKPVLVVPTLAGAFVGTWLSVKWYKPVEQTVGEQ